MQRHAGRAVVSDVVLNVARRTIRPEVGRLLLDHRRGERDGREAHRHVVVIETPLPRGVVRDVRCPGEERTGVTDHRTVERYRRQFVVVDVQDVVGSALCVAPAAMLDVKVVGPDCDRK